MRVEELLGRAGERLCTHGPLATYGWKYSDLVHFDEYLEGAAKLMESSLMP